MLDPLHNPPEVKEWELVRGFQKGTHFSAGHAAPKIAWYADYLTSSESARLGPCSAWCL